MTEHTHRQYQYLDRAVYVPAGITVNSQLLKKSRYFGLGCHSLSKDTVIDPKREERAKESNQLKD